MMVRGQRYLMTAMLGLALAASGKIKTVAETCRLDQINEVFDRMREGRITGRVVVEM